MGIGSGFGRPLASLLLVSPALQPVSAAAWEYRNLGEAHRVRVEQDGHSLTVICKKDAVLLTYEIPRQRLARELAGRSDVHAQFTPDEQPNGSGVTTSLTAKLEDKSDAVWVMARGPVVVQLAGRIAAARRDVAVGVATQKPGARYLKFNTVVFPTAGAAAAIKSTFDGCGIKS